MKRLPLLGRAAPSKPTEGEVRRPVRVWVVGAVEDAGALRFARVLAEALEAPLLRDGDPLAPEGVAVGESFASRVEATFCVVLGGTLPRGAWRASLRGVRADLTLAEPREAVALALARRLVDR
ncbi:MAG: hypothetical protein R3B99_12940 [Polyangiales bacterium]